MFGAARKFVAIGVVGDLHRKSLRRLVIDGRADERDEQRMRPGRPALEFRMGLGADQEGVHVARVLDELDQVSIR